MLTSVEGIYRDGKVELLEQPPGPAGQAVARHGVRVIVTFLDDEADQVASAGPDGSSDLAARGITPDQAADLRRRLATLTEDWDRPDMDGYDAL